MDGYLIEEILSISISQYDAWKTLAQIKILFPDIYQRIEHLRPSLNSGCLEALQNQDMDTLDRYLSKGGCLPDIDINDYPQIKEYYPKSTEWYLTRGKRICYFCRQLTESDTPLSYLDVPRVKCGCYCLEMIYVCNECLGPIDFVSNQAYHRISLAIKCHCNEYLYLAKRGLDLSSLVFVPLILAQLCWVISLFDLSLIDILITWLIIVNHLIFLILEQHKLAILFRIIIGILICVSIYWDFRIIITTCMLVFNVGTVLVLDQIKWAIINWILFRLNRIRTIDANDLDLGQSLVD